MLFIFNKVNFSVGVTDDSVLFFMGCQWVTSTKRLPYLNYITSIFNCSKNIFHMTLVHELNTFLLFIMEPNHLPKYPNILISHLLLLFIFMRLNKKVTWHIIYMIVLTLVPLMQIIPYVFNRDRKIMLRGNTCYFVCGGKRRCIITWLLFSRLLWWKKWCLLLCG